MVSRITILELHLDGAQFGPMSLGQDKKERTGSSRNDATETAGGPSRTRVVLFGGVLVVTLLAAAIAIRRIRSDDESDDSELTKHTDEEHIYEENRAEERTIGTIE